MYLLQPPAAAAAIAAILSNKLVVLEVGLDWVGDARADSDGEPDRDLDDVLVLQPLECLSLGAAILALDIERVRQIAGRHSRWRVDVELQRMRLLGLNQATAALHYSSDWIRRLDGQPKMRIVYWRPLSNRRPWRVDAPRRLTASLVRGGGTGLA